MARSTSPSCLVCSPQLGQEPFHHALFPKRIGAQVLVEGLGTRPEDVSQRNAFPPRAGLLQRTPGLLLNRLQFGQRERDGPLGLLV
jgi:hypothetical protein